MPATATLQSVSFKYAETGPSGTYTYMVFNAPSPGDAAQAPGFTPGNTGAFESDPFTGQNMICQSVSVQSVQDGIDTYQVTVEWGSAQSFSTFVSVQSDVSGTFVDAWRTATVPTGGTPTGSDMGGTKLDSAGEPVSQFIWQTNLQIARRYGIGSSVPWTAIWSNLGKRNSTSIEGAAVGQLLFKGVKVSNIDKCRWEVQYDFVGDQWYHMRQVPTRESDGRVQLDANQAREVRWFQPFTSTADFYTMLGSYSVCGD